MTPEHLRDLLAGRPVSEPPALARRAAVLILLSVPADDSDGSDIRLIYTRRRDDLRAHPGQISFPGGGLEPGETLEDAALREAQEEIGLDPASVTIAGRLEPFYLSPSRCWLSPIVAVWDAPHDLVPQPSEVAEIIHTRLSTLTDPSALRGAHLSRGGQAWAWQLDADHLLWGATGRVTEALLDIIAPGWAPAHAPEHLPADRIVQPWMRDVAPPRHPSRMARRVRAALAPNPDGTVAVAPDRGEWARQTAAVAACLLDPGDRVAVLIGAGRNGELAARVAAALEQRGHEVARHHVSGQTSAPSEEIPYADLVVDGLVGRGLVGPLIGAPLRMVHALQAFTPRVVAIDVPTGLHAGSGLIGEILTADATVAYGNPAPGLSAPGVAVFCGEIVAMAQLAGGLRPVAAPAPGEPDAGARPGWRE